MVQLSQFNQEIWEDWSYLDFYPSGNVWDEGHDDDEETEEPDRQRGEDGGVNSEIISDYKMPEIDYHQKMYSMYIAVV